jgi:hypothetical protein
LVGQLDEARRAFEAADGELGSVSFDPEDPASIEAAIQRAEGIVDDRLGAYASNLIIGPMAAQLKDKYRQAIIDQAAAARTGSGSE